MVDNITPDLIGKQISCVIRGIIIKEAIIVQCDKLYYICQDYCDGKSCKASSKGKYKHSWCIQEGTKSNLSNNDVSKIKLLKPIYELW